MAETCDEVGVKVEADEWRDDSRTISQPEEVALPFPKIEHAQTNPTDASSGRRYSAFSSGEKWFIVVLSAVAGTFS